MTKTTSRADAVSRGRPAPASKDAGEKLDERLYLQSVARALAVLESFRNAHRQKSLNEITADLGVTKSAAQRTIYTLVRHGYLERAEGSGYRLGREILDCTFDYLRMNPLVERSAPVLTELRKASNERVDLSLFDRDSIVYALRYQSKRETFYATLTGRRRPSFLSAGGRACLALLDDAAVDEILNKAERAAATPRTITDLDGIRDKIREARRETYAYAVEEAVMGEVVIAAAIVNQRREPVAAVHIAGLLGDWNVEEFRRRFGPMAVEAARELSG